MPEATERADAPLDPTRGARIDQVDTAVGLERELFEPPPRPRAAWLRGVLTVLGILFVIAGVVLGPVPVVPGFPLVIAGALMLAASNATARRGMNRLEHLLPLATRKRLRRLLRRSPPRESVAETATERPKAPPSNRA